eukprot:GHVP01047651.1.p1 GENE.GHVP01047651.1~~GHVP01047651.1.p1  ORF type:complete len:1397 (+),score=272.59 GHVP01047651.1:524-4192(+)
MWARLGSFTFLLNLARSSTEEVLENIIEVIRKGLAGCCERKINEKSIIKNLIECSRESSGEITSIAESAGLACGLNKRNDKGNANYSRIIKTIFSLSEIKESQITNFYCGVILGGLDEFWLLENGISYEESKLVALVDAIHKTKGKEGLINFLKIGALPKIVENSEFDLSNILKRCFHHLGCCLELVPELSIVYEYILMKDEDERSKYIPLLKWSQYFHLDGLEKYAKKLLYESKDNGKVDQETLNIFTIIIERHQITRHHFVILEQIFQESLVLLKNNGDEKSWKILLLIISKGIISLKQIGEVLSVIKIGMKQENTVGYAIRYIKCLLKSNGDYLSRNMRIDEPLYTALIFISTQLKGTTQADLCDILFNCFTKYSEAGGHLDQNRLLPTIFHLLSTDRRSLHRGVSLEQLLDIKKIGLTFSFRGIVYILCVLFKTKEIKTRKVIVEKLVDIYEKGCPLIQENILVCSAYLIEEIHLIRKKVCPHTFQSLKTFCIAGIIHPEKEVALINGMSFGKLCYISQDHLFVRSVLEDLHIALSQKQQYGHIITLGSIIGEIVFSNDSLIQKRSFTFLLSLWDKNEEETYFALRMAISQPAYASKALQCLQTAPVSHEYTKAVLHCIRVACPLLLLDKSLFWTSIQNILKGLWSEDLKIKKNSIDSLEVICVAMATAPENSNEKNTLISLVQSVINSKEQRAYFLQSPIIFDCLGIDILSPERINSFIEGLKFLLANEGDIDDMLKRIQYEFDSEGISAGGVLKKLDVLFSRRTFLSTQTLSTISIIRKITSKICIWISRILCKEYNEAHSAVETILFLGSQLLEQGKRGYDLLGYFLTNLFVELGGFKDSFVSEKFLLQFETQISLLISDIRDKIPPSERNRLLFHSADILGTKDEYLLGNASQEEVIQKVKDGTFYIVYNCPKNQPDDVYKMKKEEYSSLLPFYLSFMSFEHRNLMYGHILYFASKGDKNVLKATLRVLKTNQIIPDDFILNEFLDELQNLITIGENTISEVEILVYLWNENKRKEALKILLSSSEFEKIPFEELIINEKDDIILILGGLIRWIETGRSRSLLQQKNFLERLKILFSNASEYPDVFVLFLDTLSRHKAKESDVSILLVILIVANPHLICYTKLQEIFFDAIRSSELVSVKKSGLLHTLLHICENNFDGNIWHCAASLLITLLVHGNLKDKNYIQVFGLWLSKTRKIKELKVFHKTIQKLVSGNS